MNNITHNIITDNSKIITEALVKSGADVFIGYPITPANLFYLYASKRFPFFFAAPDEITTVQWMSGFAASGHIPVTATSFPGYSLMIESINMAYMMELPMVIILVQRLGPATGTATCGAQGDIAVVNGTISGGYTIPTISVSNNLDCWEIGARSVKTAVELRTPVVILTSKEEMMTLFNFDISQLKDIPAVKQNFFDKKETYKPYFPDKNLVPEFVPVTSKEHQVRLTASTHDKMGILQNTSTEAIENTIRIKNKIDTNSSKFLFYELDEQKDASVLLMSYGITSNAAKEAILKLRADGIKISLLIAKTLLPVPNIYYQIHKKYKKIIIAEENLTGQYRQIMYGMQDTPNITGINTIGKMIIPKEIIDKVMITISSANYE
ncbi:MAG: hypothetical protein V1781_03115 [Bacteroidota bacterium]